MLTAATGPDALARIGKAIADPTRTRILLAVLAGAVYPAQLAAQLGLTRANCSNHLTRLRSCGLVIATPEGRQVRYDIADASLARALTDLVSVVLALDTGRSCGLGPSDAAQADGRSPSAAPSVRVLR